MRLIVIPISHYCERARWALEYAGLDFTEERHLQMFHRRPVRRAGGRRTTPVLVTNDGTCLADSADIVQYADANGSRPLYPQEPSLRQEVLELEEEMAGPFAVETRRVAYFEFGSDKAMMLRYNNQGAPRLQRLAMRLAFRPAVRSLNRYLKVNEAHIAAGRGAIDAMFTKVADILADGRRYLFGDAFTAADLTFASMAAPVVAPPQYGVALPKLDEVSPSARAIFDHFRSLPAGKFALRIYREDRN